MNKNSSNQPMMAGFEPNQPLMPVQNAQVAIKKVVPIMDPRTVPVVQVDNGLPAVAPAYLNAGHLRQAFGSSLDWQPELRDEHRWTSKPPAKAAVLVALVQRQEINVLLTQRSAGLSNHSGQIAFPGGRQDPEDHNANDTALREAWEEVGLARDRVDKGQALREQLQRVLVVVGRMCWVQGLRVKPVAHDGHALHELRQTMHDHRADDSAADGCRAADDHDCDQVE